MTCNDRGGFSPVHLCILARLKFEGEKHVWCARGDLAGRDVVTNGGFAALVALFSENLKDPVGGVALFAWELLIVAKKGLNAGLVRAKNRGRPGARQLVRLQGIIGNGSSNGIAAASFFFGNLANAFFLQVKGASNAN